MNYNSEVAVQAYIFCVKLLLKSVQQRRVKVLHVLRINYENASKVLINQASTAIRPNSHFAVSLLAYLLIVLIKHIVEVLLYVIQIQEYANDPILHLQNDLIDDLIDGDLILIIWEVTAIEYLVRFLVLPTEILNELQCVLLIISDDHLMSGL